MLKIIIGILVIFWLLGLVMKLIGWITGAISSLFYILIIIALILFVIDLISGGRRKV